MNTLWITGFGLLALAAIVWQSWREREREAERISPEWTVALGRISNDQALGHYRDARRSALLWLQKLAREPANSRLASRLRTSLAALMARDSVYPVVVRAIRSACAAEPAVTELALCVGLRRFLSGLRVRLESALTRMGSSTMSIDFMVVRVSSRKLTWASLGNTT